MKQPKCDFYYIVGNQWAIPLNAVYLLDSAQHLEPHNDQLSHAMVVISDLKQWLNLPSHTELNVTPFRLKENLLIPVIAIGQMPAVNLTKVVEANNHLVIVLNYHERGAIALIVERRVGSNSHGYISQSSEGFTVIEGPSAA